jgi:uncharacterized iron-regulated protein
MRNQAKAEDSRSHFERWRRLQQEMQSALEQRLAAMLAEAPPHIERYKARFERSFPAWTGSSLRPARLGERLAEAELVLVGDYHSLAQSQRSALRLLRRLRRRGVSPCLALEMIPSQFQPELDAFLTGRLSSRAFAKLAVEAGFWDFNWRPIQTLLDFARHHELPVIGLNTEVRRADRALQERDRHAADLLAARRLAEPERPLFVLYGDYHLADAHLPAAIRRACKRAGVAPPRSLRVFQNREPLFWESLGPRGRSPELLLLEGGDVCIQGATPLVKLQSFLYWLNFHDLEDEDPDPADHCEDLGHEVDAAMKRIAHFLRIPILEQAPPRVYWLGDADFARQIAQESGWEEAELALVQSSLAQGEDCYLQSRDLAVISEPGQNRLAELAARVLHGRTAGLGNRPRTLADDFYLRVISQALLFLGSKLINPLRKSPDRPALIRNLREGRGNRGEWRDRAELQLAYLEAEERYLHEGDIDGFSGRFFGLDGPRHLSLTRALGHNLGGRLYEALVDETLDPFWLRELWFESFNLEGSPLRQYFDILEQLGSSRELRLARGERESL